MPTIYEALLEEAKMFQQENRKKFTKEELHQIVYGTTPDDVKNEFLKNKNTVIAFYKSKMLPLSTILILASAAAVYYVTKYHFGFTTLWVVLSVIFLVLLFTQVLVTLPWIVIRSNADHQERAVDASSALTGILRNLTLQDGIEKKSYQSLRLQSDFHKVWVSFPKHGMVNEHENGFSFPSLTHLPRVGDEISFRGVEENIQKEKIDEMLKFNKNIFISSFKVTGIVWSPFGDNKIVNIQVEECNHNVFFRGKDL